MQKEKIIIYSAIKPTGIPTIGNYLGALKLWKELSENSNYFCIFMVANLHSFTIIEAFKNPKQLWENTWSTFCMLLSIGIEEKTIITIQSMIGIHESMQWLFECIVPFGSLTRMIQFKEHKEKKKVRAGMFSYPSLMAADILLYDTTYVPIGIDQKQHLEHTNFIGEKFNKIYKKKIFKKVFPLFSSTPKIQNLTDPTKKMSKTSEDPLSYIGLLDTDEEIKRKIMMAKTDNKNIFLADDNWSDGITNLINIYANFSNISIKEAANILNTLTYFQLKNKIINIIIINIEIIRKKFNSLFENKEYLKNIANKNAIIAKKIAIKKLKQVYKIINIPYLQFKNYE